MAIDVNNLVLYSSPYTVEQIDESVAAGFEAREIAQQLRTDAENGAFDGADGKGLVIEGFFATVEELINSVSNPTVGAAYGVGTAAPYDIYVWDAINQRWVNNGPLGVAGGGTGDVTGIPPHGDTGQVLKKLSDADYDVSWSEAVPDGSVTRAKLAQDALYSPAIVRGTSDFVATDVGGTVQNPWDTSATYTLTQSFSSTLPTGATIAVARMGLWTTTFSVQIQSNGVRMSIPGDKYYTGTVVLEINEFFGLVALRKFSSNDTYGDLWAAIGPVEVVT